MFKRKRKKAYTLIELVIVIGILAIISTIASLNINRLKNTVNKISLESTINEARSILTFGKHYCRKNRVNGSIVIHENRISFVVKERGYEITKIIANIDNIEINSNFSNGSSKIDTDGYIKSAGTIVVKKGNYYGEIKIGVGNDIIGISEVDIIE